jgi:DNA-binding SARP family transcriptional activator
VRLPAARIQGPVEALPAEPVTSLAAARRTSPDAEEARSRLTLLGSFSLNVAGEQVVLPPSAQRLLAFVGMFSPVDRRSTAGILWPDTNEARAAGSLRSALSKLQHLCPSAAINVGTQLELSREIDVDAAELRRLGAEAIGGRDRIAQIAARLLELGSELLPTWDEEWLYFEREQLRQIRIQALECAADQLSRTGHHGTAMLVAYEAIRLEPLRESSHRQVIAIHLAQGNQAQAVDAYHSLAARLWRHYRVRPSPLLTELVQNLCDTTGPPREVRSRMPRPDEA